MIKSQEALAALRDYYLPIVFIGLCYLAITMMWTLYGAYVPIFLDKDFGLSAASIGLVMMLDNLAAFFIQPWIGARSDRLRTSLGRRLPIILLAAPFAALGFALIPLVSGVFGGMVGFFLVLSMMLLAMAAMRVPLFALMPDLVPPERRSTANGLINLFGGLGTLIAALALGTMYRTNRAGPFLLAAGVLLASVLMLFIVLKLRAPEQLQPDPPSLGDDQDLPPLSNMVEMVREILASRGHGIRTLLFVILIYTFGFNAIESFFTLFGTTQLGIPEERGLRLVGFLFIAYLIASVPAGIAGRRFGRRLSMVAGLAILSLALGIAFIFPSLTMYVVMMPIGGVAWALINSNALPAVVNLSAASLAGSAVGLYYASTTLASILSPPVNGWVVDATGGDYGFIALVASLAAAVAAVLLFPTLRGPSDPVPAGDGQPAESV